MKRFISAALALALFAVPAYAAQLYPAPIFGWAADDGSPASGWKVHTYEAGTTTPKTTYTDASAGTPNANPVVLDSRGEAPIYFDGSYKLVIKNASDVIQATFDNFGASESGTTPVVSLVYNGSFETDTTGDNLPDEWTTVKYDAGTSVITLISSSQAHGANSLKFQSLGSGGGTAMQDGYSEVSPARVYQFSFSLLSSVADVRNVVEVFYYDSAKTYISTQTVYDESAANPTGMTLKQYGLTVPATARFARVKLTGCHSSDSTPGYTLFDDIHIFEINNDTGVTATAFDINSDGNKGTLTASGLTANRTFTLPDETGTVALIADLENEAHYNPIINGLFDIWQRGASFTSIATTAYSADRWTNTHVGTVVLDVLRSTDVPTSAQAGQLFKYSFHVDVTTADASMAAGDLVAVYQKIEGYNFKPFVGRTATLVFWVKATKTGTYCVAFINSGNDRSYVAEYTISVADTWEKKTVTLNFNETGGTWNYGFGVGVIAVFTLAAGSDYHASAAGAWETGGFYSTSNQVNGVDNAANDFRITGVGIYFGDTAPAHPKPRSFATELALCQRYFFKTFPYNTAPESNTGGGILFPAVKSGAVINYVQSITFPTLMRTSPTLTLYNPAAAGSEIHDTVISNNFSSSNSVGTDSYFRVSGTGHASTTQGNPCTFHLTADAEM